MSALKRFWHWLRCEDVDGKSTYRYSKQIKYFPCHGKIGKEDILQLSHKLDNGEYETCYATVKQLKDAILEMA